MEKKLGNEDRVSVSLEKKLLAYKKTCTSEWMTLTSVWKVSMSFYGYFRREGPNKCIINVDEEVAAGECA